MLSLGVSSTSWGLYLSDLSTGFVARFFCPFGPVVASSIVFLASSACCSGVAASEGIVASASSSDTLGS